MGSIQNEDHMQKPPPFHLTEVDRQILAQTDDEFVYHDWEELSGIIARNDLAVLRRKPSDLRRYMAWTSEIKTTYGSITNYICQKRLNWTSASSPDIAQIKYINPTPFADAADYRVLRNDWPYGLTPDIKHIVVWSKTPIATKPENGDVTDESRALIEAFVDRTFVSRLQSDPAFAGLAKDAIREQNILWFKNWAALQSVRSLEHFHLLVRGVPDEIITEWTKEESVVQVIL